MVGPPGGCCLGMATLSHSPVMVARVALKCAEAVLPRYMSKYSRHDGCTFPQLAACLVLKGFWNTSLRGVQVQLQDAQEVRQALGLTHQPRYSALFRAHHALSLGQLEDFSEEAVRLALSAHALPDAASKEAILVADSTGLTPSPATQYAAGSRSAYARARHERAKRRAAARGRALKRKKPPKRAWRYPKWTLVMDRTSHLLLAQSARRGPYPDVQDFAPLALRAHALRASRLVLADAGFESSDNLRLCEEWLGARAVMRLHHHSLEAPRLKCPYRRALAHHLPRRTYRLRNSVESAFSAHKRRFGDRTPSRTEAARFRDVLLHGVLHNCALLRR